MSTEKEITILVIGQTTFSTGYDCDVYVMDDDLTQRFKRGQRYLDSIGEDILLENNPLPMIKEGIISAPRVATTFKIMDCLVDNRFEPRVFGDNIQAFIIAGLPQDVTNVRNLINENVRRVFPNASGEKNDGAYDEEFSYQVEHDFNLFTFSSANDVLEFLHQKKKAKNEK